MAAKAPPAASAGAATASTSTPSAASASGNASTDSSDPPIIDMETFNQLLEIDDDDNREFSKGLAQQYVEQAESTFQEMDEALKKEDLSSLHKLGHFLKGSSASVGLVTVSQSCAEMQNYGGLLNAEGSAKIERKEALEKVEALMPVLKKEQGRAKKWLEDYYKEKW